VSFGDEIDRAAELADQRSRKRLDALDVRDRRRVEEVDQHQVSARCERALDRMRATIAAEVRSARAARTLDDSLGEAALSTRELTRRWPQFVDRHLCTLGGGNHFIELDRDADDGLWLLVHSGSRGVGGAIAEHHQRAARSRARGPLAALDVRGEHGAGFLSGLAHAARFAAHNRAQLAGASVDCVRFALDSAVQELESFDVAHNIIEREEHHGRSLLVHRKRATRARAGDRVVIPGSMATATYLGEGLGDPRSWCCGRTTRRWAANSTSSRCSTW